MQRNKKKGENAVTKIINSLYAQNNHTSAIENFEEEQRYPDMLPDDNVNNSAGANAGANPKLDAKELLPIVQDQSSEVTGLLNLAKEKNSLDVFRLAAKQAGVGIEVNDGDFCKAFDLTAKDLKNANKKIDDKLVDDVIDIYVNNNVHRGNYLLAISTLDGFKNNTLPQAGCSEKFNKQFEKLYHDDVKVKLAVAQAEIILKELNKNEENSATSTVDNLKSENEKIKTAAVDFLKILDVCSGKSPGEYKDFKLENFNNDASEKMGAIKNDNRKLYNALHGMGVRPIEKAYDDHLKAIEAEKKRIVKETKKLGKNEFKKKNKTKENEYAEAKNKLSKNVDDYIQCLELTGNSHNHVLTQTHNFLENPGNVLLNEANIAKPFKKDFGVDLFVIHDLAQQYPSSPSRANNANSLSEAFSSSDNNNNTDDYASSYSSRSDDDSNNGEDSDEFSYHSDNEKLEARSHNNEETEANNKRYQGGLQKFGIYSHNKPSVPARPAQHTSSNEGTDADLEDIENSDDDNTPPSSPR